MSGSVNVARPCSKYVMNGVDELTPEAGMCCRIVQSHQVLTFNLPKFQAVN